ncbi:MAG: maleylpyruvate isomerase N-terminal domain-containing protein [Chloroflexi bacterium]|nr:maleylpyruvate isomerase N-terminal domain-containing protein [Chloroflexota bacterium]
MNNVDRLIVTVERFCAFITGLPDAALEEEDWGPREVLAHLVFHHELYVTLVEAKISGKQVGLYRGRFSDMNALAVSANRGVLPDQLVERFIKANQRLVVLYKEHDPRKICFQIKADSKPRSLAALIPEVEAHIRNHFEKLRKEYRVDVPNKTKRREKVT